MNLFKFSILVIFLTIFIRVSLDILNKKKAEQKEKILEVKKEKNIKQYFTKDEVLIKIKKSECNIVETIETAMMLGYVLTKFEIANDNIDNDTSEFYYFTFDKKINRKDYEN